MNWRFSVADGTPWLASVAAVPTELKEKQFYEVAVPRLASPGHVVTFQPCIVVCHVAAPAYNRVPGGPVGRAKGLLDALHDNRWSGPYYRDLGVSPPLANDDPEHVAGLAVEVTPGNSLTEYVIGTSLRIRGDLVASVPVLFAAPNDVSGTPTETQRIAEARISYGRAVRDAFARSGARPREQPGALVIRHRPQRDADNTWRTWLNALCSTASGREHWAAGAPLAGWRPTAIATTADGGLDAEVLYQLWT